MTTNETEVLEVHVVSEGDYARLYEEQKAENERLKLLIEAARVNSPNAPAANRSKGTAMRVRAVIGDAGWSKMSRAEKITAVGGDPTVSDEFISRIFGRQANAGLAKDCLGPTQPVTPSCVRLLSRLAFTQPKTLYSGMPYRRGTLGRSVPLLNLWYETTRLRGRGTTLGVRLSVMDEGCYGTRYDHARTFGTWRGCLSAALP